EALAQDRAAHVDADHHSAKRGGCIGLEQLIPGIVDRLDRLNLAFPIENGEKQFAVLGLPAGVRLDLFANQIGVVRVGRPRVLPFSPSLFYGSSTAPSLSGFALSQDALPLGLFFLADFARAGVAASQHGD